jgi:hypothetical protein
MRTLRWTFCAAIVLSVSGCVVNVGCDLPEDCLGGEYCGTDNFCHDLSEDSIYESCYVVTDCYAGGQSCYDVTSSVGTSGTFCSIGCASSADCPSNRGQPGVCIDATGAGDFLCYQQCLDDLDCEPGSRCFDFTVTRACLPN